MKWWASFYLTKAMGGFELHSPWWITGMRCADDAQTICAAIAAATEEEAIEIIYASFDNRPTDIEWRFIEPRPDTWTPFSSRFPWADWMRWGAASGATA